MAATRSLTARDLSCRRGGRLLFERLSFTLKSGEGLLLTGPNGTGKTSLLRLIAGLLPLETGSLALQPEEGERGLQEEIHYVGHAGGLKSSLTVQENLAFWASFYGEAKADRETLLDALAEFGLDGIAHLPAGLLSAGQKRKLSLARLLVAKRPLWLLDEPSVSLDTASTRRLSQIIAAHLKQGGLAMVASHTPLGLRFSQRLDLAEAAAEKAAAKPGTRAA